MFALAWKFFRHANLAATMLFLTISLGQAESERVPAAHRGYWNLADCSSSRAAVLLASDFALLFETDPSQGQVVAMGPVKWSGETAVMWPGGAPFVLPPTKAMSRCSNMPPAAYASFGEAIALLSALDDISEVCARDTARSCAQAAFSFADVSGDKRLSVAEISRVMRAVATIISYEGSIQARTDSATSSFKLPVQSLVGATIFVTLTGPLVTRGLLASYDFDADQLLSLEEIMQDREPLLEASVAEGLGASIGAASAQALIAAFVGTVVKNSGQVFGPLVGGFLR